MALFQVLLDWVLMLLTLTGEAFYLHKIVSEENTVLMEMMKYLILNDLIFFPVILAHDIPSYFMEHSIAERVFIVKELGIFAQCLPFFYALLMLPIFALLNLVAIIAVYAFVAFKKRHISQIAIIICYVISVGMSIPLMTDYCGFEYNSTTHYWYYDYSKPYTARYQQLNGILQIIAFGIVIIAMSIVLIYLAKRARTFAHAPTSIGRSSGPIQSQNGSTRVTHATQVSQHQTQSKENRIRPVQQRRSILDQAFAFIVLCLCFIAGTVSYNFIYCNGTICMLITIISSYFNRGKWLLYCFLMRREATISRLFRR